jgi:hypothetical protein
MRVAKMLRLSHAGLHRAELGSLKGLKMKKILTVVIFAGVVAGCATPYDTKKSGWTAGMGFSQTQLGPDLWQVDFTGNNHTDRDTTKKYVLRKAAEIAQREGYGYFKTVDAQTAKDTTGASSAGYFNTFGGGQTYAQTQTTTNITVQLLKTKDPNATGVVYDAAFLMSSVPTK